MFLCGFAGWTSAMYSPHKEGTMTTGGCVRQLQMWLKLKHILWWECPLSNSFGASSFHIWHKGLGRWLEKLSLEGFWGGHEPLMTFHIEVSSLITDHILLAEFGELAMDRFFNNSLSTSWLVNQATSLSWHLTNKEFDTWHKLATMQRHHEGLSQWETQHHQTSHLMISRRFFLLTSETVFYFVRKKLHYLHLKDIFIYECELYLKQPLTPPQRKIIDAYWTSNHRLAIETWWWSTIPISRYNR